MWVNARWAAAFVLYELVNCVACVLSELVSCVVLCGVPQRGSILHTKLCMRPRACMFYVRSDVGLGAGWGYKDQSAPARGVCDVLSHVGTGPDSPRGEYIQSNTMLIYIQLQH